LVFALLDEGGGTSDIEGDRGLLLVEASAATEGEESIAGVSMGVYLRSRAIVRDLGHGRTGGCQRIRN